MQDKEPFERTGSFSIIFCIAQKGEDVHHCVGPAFRVLCWDVIVMREGRHETVQD